MIGSKLQPEGVEPMHASLPFDPESRLKEVADIFEQWRTTRNKRDRVPESLWQVAVKLAPFYSISKIARTLRLNFNELKRRIDGCTSETPSCEFVELKVEQMFGSAPCRLRLCSPTGFELEIQAQGELPSQLHNLMSCFLKECR
jgi:hypothetical protein